MKLSELIHNIWKNEKMRKLGIRKDEVKIIVEVFTEEIIKALIKDKVVKLRGLFTLEIRKIKGRKIRNPRSGEEMYSKDYYKVGLTPSKDLSKELKKLKEEE